MNCGVPAMNELNQHCAAWRKLRRNHGGTGSPQLVRDSIILCRRAPPFLVCLLFLVSTSLFRLRSDGIYRTWGLPAWSTVLLHTTVITASLSS